MNDDQFTKIFNYMEKRFDEIGGRFDKQDKRFDDLAGLIDGYANHLDTYAQEMAAMQHKINRLEKYVQVIAQKAGVDLDTIHA